MTGASQFAHPEILNHFSAVMTVIMFYWFQRQAKVLGI